MKKWYLVSSILAAMLLAIGCAPKVPIPPAAISEIYAMSEAKDVREYVEVKAVQDREAYRYIMVYIKSPPGEVISLEDAYDQAVLYTRTFAEGAVKILAEHGINEDVSVWAQLPLKEGGVTVLGHTFYDAKTDSYYDFERYEP